MVGSGGMAPQDERLGMGEVQRSARDEQGGRRERLQQRAAVLKDKIEEMQEENQRLADRLERLRSLLAHHSEEFRRRSARNGKESPIGEILAGINNL